MENQRNPEDVVSFDVPLFIRLLEFAREDATDDIALHKVTDNIINMCQDGQVLDMNDYEKIIDITPDTPTDNMNSLDERVLKIAGIK